MQGGTPTPSRRRGAWLRWLVGVALLGSVVAAGLHVTEGRELVRLAERAQPAWLLLAVLLQAGTYLAQGQVWRIVATAARSPLPLSAAWELSLTKLFVDQALPSGGISGTAVVARTLQDRGMPRPAVMAGVVIDTASYQATYVICLATALVVSLAHRQASALLEVVASLFGLAALAVTLGLLALAGRKVRRPAGPFKVLRPLGKILQFLEDADPRLSRKPRLLIQGGLCHLAIFLLDAATLWSLIRALGAPASPSGVFASFMVSTLFRTVGVVPGGLGTFEATSVLTLKLIGVALPVALSATLLFRGLSFWLPMLPGLWFSRRLTVPRRPEMLRPDLATYWALLPREVLARLSAGPDGLSSGEAATRLRRFGLNELREQRRLSRIRVLLGQLRSPLLLLLLFAAAVSAFTAQWTDAAIVLTIVVVSVGVSYRREYTAQAAAAALRSRVQTRARVLRDGVVHMIPAEEVVPGDVVLLEAGSLVPADGVLLEAADCFVSEAVLTGESFPVEKRPGISLPDTPLRRRSGCVFLGTNVRSGTARYLAVQTGPSTEFGAIAHRLSLRAPATEFDRGIQRFGYLLTTAMLVMVLLVFAAHMLQERPVVETLLFSIALAVGLSPELLPAILSVNLARGAEMMARRGVLVRRLNAIENLGSMDVLCTDKTGTLTEGVVRLQGAYDPDGRPSDEVLHLATANASLETGLPNALDEAILQSGAPPPTGLRKLAEIPFDFVRKRVSVVVEEDGAGIRLITKGAFHRILPICDRLPGGVPLEASGRAELEQQHRRWSSQGIRVLAVAVRTLKPQSSYGREDERQLVFTGFLTFLDRPKSGVSEAIAEFAGLGVAIKLITGDSELVARHVASLVGLPAGRVLTGRQLDDLHDEALWREAERTDLFVEVDPNQKERIILSLKKMGHVVGFLGDGVNDAPAMHAADTSLSVEKAVDVAREAADFVLLERGLHVIRAGVEEGRKTFANTLKYILTTTSANLGNMVSMALASLFLPFLPLLAGQILLNNLLSDIPAVGMAGDSVDPELIDRPRRWDLRFIGRFMVEFGALSSLIDLLTFGVLLVLFQAGPALFRTGWFVGSLLTELVIALVVRTRRPFFHSRPGSLLLASTLALIAVALAISYLPHVELLGFQPLPAALLGVLVGITVLYVAATELLKRWFYRRPHASQRRRPTLDSA